MVPGKYKVKRAILSNILGSTGTSSSRYITKEYGSLLNLFNFPNYSDLYLNILHLSISLIAGLVIIYLGIVALSLTLKFSNWRNRYSRKLSVVQCRICGVVQQGDSYIQVECLLNYSEYCTKLQILWSRKRLSVSANSGQKSNA